MKRLMVGDTFHPTDHDRNPYVVRGVLKDGYMVQQSGDDVEEYSISVIHDLFKSENPWKLKRKVSPVFTSVNDDLFRV